MSLPKKIKDTIFATGRRKTSVARVKMVKGKGNIVVNKKPVDDYFPAGNYVMVIKQPLGAVELKGDYDIFVNVYGGGLTGQSGAIRQGIAMALSTMDEKYHEMLRKTVFMTRD